MDKNLFKTQMDLLTFIKYLEKDKVIDNINANKMRNYATEYINQRKLVRKGVECYVNYMEFKLTNK